MADDRQFQARVARVAAEVLRQLQERWPRTRPQTQAQVTPLLEALRAELELAASDVERGTRIDAFLRRLQAISDTGALGDALERLVPTGVVRSIAQVSPAEAEALSALAAAVTGPEAAVKTPLAEPVEPPTTDQWTWSGPTYRDPVATMTAVAQRLIGHRSELPPAVDDQVRALLDEFRNEIRWAENDLKRSLVIHRFLSAIEAIPEVAALVGDILAAGRTETMRDALGVAEAAVQPMLDAIFSREQAMIEPEPPTQGGGEGLQDKSVLEPAATTVTLHTKVDFPAEVLIAEPVVPLIVQLTIERPTVTVADAQMRVPFVDTRRPELVTVVARLQGFTEITGDPSRTILVYAFKDSQPAVFLLRPEMPGTQRIVLDFYHQERLIGTASFDTTVRARPPLGQSGRAEMRQRLVITELPRVDINPVDLELRVTVGANNTEIHFMLHSVKPEVGYHWQQVGSVQLDAEPQLFLDNTFNRLNRMARRGETSRTEEETQAFTAALVQIGQYLYEKLFSPELKREYRERIHGLAESGVVKNVLITSDEPWIPWELVKPYEADARSGQVQVDDDFLCARFRLSRWLAGRGVPNRVVVHSAQLVAPPSDLPAVEQERQYFAGLPQSHGIAVLAPIDTAQSVLATFENGQTQLYHFACHGNFDADNADESPLGLRGDILAPSDLVGPPQSGVTRSKPLIFLNACHAGRVGRSIRGMGGWAQRFVQAGASAFVGALWEVNDRLSAQFAIDFYERLWRGEALGEAFYNARQHVRQLDPANPTWLAYTLYADPNGKAQVGDQ